MSAHAIAACGLICAVTGAVAVQPKRAMQEAAYVVSCGDQDRGVAMLLPKAVSADHWTTNVEPCGQLQLRSSEARASAGKTLAICKAPAENRRYSGCLTSARGCSVKLRHLALGRYDIEPGGSPHPKRQHAQERPERGRPLPPLRFCDSNSLPHGHYCSDAQPRKTHVRRGRARRRARLGRPPASI